MVTLEANSPARPLSLTSRPHRSCRPYRAAIAFPLGSDPSAPRFATAHSHARRTSTPAVLAECPRHQVGLRPRLRGAGSRLLSGEFAGHAHPLDQPAQPLMATVSCCD